MTIEQAIARVVAREKRWAAVSARNEAVSQQLQDGRVPEAIASRFGVSPHYVRRVGGKSPRVVKVRPRVRRNIPGLCETQSAVMSVIVSIHRAGGKMQGIKILAEQAGVSYENAKGAIRRLRAIGFLEPANRRFASTKPTIIGLEAAGL